MTKKIIMAAAMIIVAVCLLSGGCSQVENNKINSWRDLLKIPASSEETAQNTSEPAVVPDGNSGEAVEKISVRLYFIDPKQNKLAVEERSIDKVEGIARQTMAELIKGPSSAEYEAVFPAGTRLLDINIKPEGLCIVDLSSEADKIAGQEQGNFMIQAVADTLGQFPSIKEVSFLINGEKVNTLGGAVSIAKPVQVDYNR